MAAEPMFAEERQNQILQLLRRQKKLLVSELCDTFGVSPATIRNDLNDLERQGLLRRTHGGAIAGTKINFEPTSVEKDVANREQKMAIGQAAAELVEEGDTIAVDTGTTTYYLAQALSGKSRLTVVTPDLVIARTAGRCARAFPARWGRSPTACSSPWRWTRCFWRPIRSAPPGSSVRPILNRRKLKRTCEGWATRLSCSATAPNSGRKASPNSVSSRIWIWSSPTGGPTRRHCSGCVLWKSRWKRFDGNTAGDPAA